MSQQSRIVDELENQRFSSLGNSVLTNRIKRIVSVQEFPT